MKNRRRRTEIHRHHRRIVAVKKEKVNQHRERSAPGPLRV